MKSEQRVALETLGLEQLTLFVGLMLAERTRAAIETRGFEGLRFQHGFVFQHLLREAPTISELARLLEVSQQAASKKVHELVALGYVELRADERDGRVSRLYLSARGEEAIEAAREERAGMEEALRRELGEERVAATREVLIGLLEGADEREHIALRRVRWPGT